MDGEEDEMEPKGLDGSARSGVVVRVRINVEAEGWRVRCCVLSALRDAEATVLVSARFVSSEAMLFQREA